MHWADTAGLVPIVVVQHHEWCISFVLQIGYATVFFWEYFGPLALYTLVYLLPQLAYPNQKCVFGWSTAVRCYAALLSDAVWM